MEGQVTAGQVVLDFCVMIKTYGLHWTIKRVCWGEPGKGNPGTLLGATTRSKKANPVDFRLQRGIYALYADYQLI